MPVLGADCTSSGETFCGVNARWRLFKCGLPVEFCHICEVTDVLLQIQSRSCVSLSMSALLQHLRVDIFFLAATARTSTAVGQVPPFMHNSIHVLQNA